MTEKKTISNTEEKSKSFLTSPAGQISLVYSVVFAVTCVFLLYRAGADNWSGWESVLLGILMWGGAGFAWLSVTFLAAGLTSITGGVSDGWIQWAIVAVAFFFAVASVQFCVLRFLLECIVWVQSLIVGLLRRRR